VCVCVSVCVWALVGEVPKGCSSVPWTCVVGDCIMSPDVA